MRRADAIRGAGAALLAIGFHGMANPAAAAESAPSPGKPSTDGPVKENNAIPRPDKVKPPRAKPAAPRPPKIEKPAALTPPKSEPIDLGCTSSE